MLERVEVPSDPAICLGQVVASLHGGELDVDGDRELERPLQVADGRVRVTPYESEASHGGVRTDPRMAEGVSSSDDLADALQLTPPPAVVVLRRVEQSRAERSLLRQPDVPEERQAFAPALHLERVV